jgi:shikimate kinase
VGLPGSGKSTVGRQLARRVDLRFIDTDHVLEHRMGCSIREFFEREGEPAFRDLEESVIDELSLGGDCVLSTGGGAVLNPETRAELKIRAVTVWMRADLETVAARVQRRDTRPLLRGRDPLEALTAMAEVRYPYYAAADLTVDVASGAHAEAVEGIVRALEAYWAGATV